MIDIDAIRKRMRGDGRGALAQAFVDALSAGFAAHGPAAIERLRESKVDVYQRLVAAVQPDESDLHRDLAHGVTSEEALEIIENLDRWIRENPDPAVGATGRP